MVIEQVSGNRYQVLAKGDNDLYFNQCRVSGIQHIATYNTILLLIIFLFLVPAEPESKSKK